MKMASLESQEEAGILSGEIKCVDIKKSDTPKGSFSVSTDAEVRNRGARKGFETPVVHGVNDECSTLRVLSSKDRGVLAIALNIPPGDNGRKVKTLRN